MNNPNQIANKIITIVKSEEDVDVRPLLKNIKISADYALVTSALDQALESIDNSLHLARLHKIISDFSARFCAHQKCTLHQKYAYESIREAVESSVVSPIIKSSDRRLRTSKIQLPVRIDLAGGWTDTPPYSLERGGKVLNMAVSVNGSYPIEVTARQISNRLIRLISIDQNQKIEIPKFSGD